VCRKLVVFLLITFAGREGPELGTGFTPDNSVDVKSNYVNNLY